MLALGAMLLERQVLACRSSSTNAIRLPRHSQKNVLSWKEFKGFVKWPLLRYSRWRRIPDVKAEVRLDTRCSELSFWVSLDFLPRCNACHTFSLVA